MVHGSTILTISIQSLSIIYKVLNMIRYIIISNILQSLGTSHETSEYYLHLSRSITTYHTDSHSVDFHEVPN